MKFPFVSRSSLQVWYDLSNVQIEIISTKMELISFLKREIEDRDRQISALTETLTGPSVTVTPKLTPESQKGTKVKSPIAFGHSGWRARSSAYSESTIPPPNDSVKQLEEKVKREGGKV